MNFERVLIDLLKRGTFDLIGELRKMNENLEFIGSQLDELKLGIDALVEQGENI